jgi:hypothetical protein
MHLSDGYVINSLNIKSRATLMLSTNNNNSDDKDWDGIGDVQFNAKGTSDDDADDNNKEIKFYVDNKNDPERNVTPRKFVGGTSLFSPSTTQEQPTTRSTNQPDDQVYVVNEREIKLVSVFEQTLPIQVLALFAAICFTIYIGFSGGITDGSDRNNYFLDDVDGTIQLVEPEISDYLNNNNNDENIDNGQSVFI